MFHYIFHSFLKLRPDRDVRDDDVQRNIGYQDVPGGPAVKNPPANAGNEHKFNPWPRKIPHAMGKLRHHHY